LQRAITFSYTIPSELLNQADRLVGGDDAVLVIDDTAVPKKCEHSVGVAPQYASALGKTANCQTFRATLLAPVRNGLPIKTRLAHSAAEFVGHGS
jgi:SRSO17 transposase